MSQKFKYLTLTELLYRKVIDRLTTARSEVEAKAIKVPGFTLIKDLSNFSSGTSVLIGVFKNQRTGKTVFVKKYAFQSKGVRYASLINELSMAEVITKYQLNSIPHLNVEIPKQINVKTDGNDITIVSEYKTGVPLKFSNAKVILENVTKVLNALQYINQHITAELPELPTRKSPYLAMSFMYFWLKLMIKDHTEYRRNCKLLKFFYKYYFSSINQKKDYGLVHRDLHSRNILLKDKKVIITDWEGAVVMDRLYDLAMMGRLYQQELSTHNLITLINRFLKTTDEKKRFIFLTLFHITQTLALDDKKSVSYSDTKHYINALFTAIIPNLLGTVS